MKHILVIIHIILLTAMAAVANDEHHGSAEATGHEASAHHEFENEIALFIGGTDEKGHATESTYALEYVYELAPGWAIGGTFEYVGGELRNTILAVPVYWKPVGGLFLLAGPGVEYHEGRGREEHFAAKSEASFDKNETYFLFRVGAGYAFHVGERYSISPNVNLDFVNHEEVLVFGVSFGVMF